MKWDLETYLKQPAWFVESLSQMINEDNSYQSKQARRMKNKNNYGK